MKLLVTMILGLSACATTMVSAQTNPAALGQNALGEECALRPRTDLVVPPGISADSRLFCAKKLTGSVNHLPVKGQVGIFFPYKFYVSTHQTYPTHPLLKKVNIFF